jgi:hypothetical protein
MSQKNEKCSKIVKEFAYQKRIDLRIELLVAKIHSIPGNNEFLSGSDFHDCDKI